MKGMVIKMEVYNKNRDLNNGMHDEIREQNEKLKNAPFKEKFKYFMDYYSKITIVIIVIIATVIYIAYSMITSPKDTAFAAYLFNSSGKPADTELQDKFIEHLGIDTDEYFAYIDSTMYYTSGNVSTDVYAHINKTMAVMYNGELDVIVGDATAIDYFSYGEYFHDITTILPDDLLEQFKDKLYYAVVNENGDKVPVGIYVTDSPKLNKYSYYPNSDPILCFISNSNSIDNAIEFLRYIYMED